MLSMIYISDPVSTGLCLYIIIVCTDDMIVGMYLCVLLAASSTVHYCLTVCCIVVCIYCAPYLYPRLRNTVSLQRSMYDT